MKVINKTNYLSDKSVEYLAEGLESRLKASATLTLQASTPVGYMTFKITDVESDTVEATLERMNMGRLD